MLGGQKRVKTVKYGGDTRPGHGGHARLTGPWPPPRWPWPAGRQMAVRPLARAGQWPPRGQPRPAWPRPRPSGHSPRPAPDPGCTGGQWHAVFGEKHMPLAYHMGFVCHPPFCALIEQKICRTPGGAEGVSGIVGGAGVAGWAQGNHVSAMLCYGFAAVFQCPS